MTTTAAGAERIAATERAASGRWSRDASVGGNIACFINHSCTPNCWFRVVETTIWIRALRLIPAGEELTYDYATVGDHTIRCRCRPGCTTRL